MFLLLKNKEKKKKKKQKNLKEKKISHILKFYLLEKMNILEMY